MVRGIGCRFAVAVALLGGGTGACADDEGGGGDVDAGADTSGPSLCTKYGGAANIASVVTTYVVPRIAGDCRIGRFFTALSPDALDHVVACLTVQVQELFGCAGVRYQGASDARGVACRSMDEAHAGLQVSQGDFDALIEDVAAGLAAAGVEADDINAAAPALIGMSTQIVEQPTVSEPTAESCP